MESKRSKNIEKPEKFSMKEALTEVQIEESRFVKKERFSIRDFLWNYPSLIKRFFNRLIPFSYIFIFSIVAVLLLFLLESNVIARIVDDSKVCLLYTSRCV